MSDKQITIISKADYLGQRILEVNADLLKWLRSRGNSYDSEKDILRLVKYERRKAYHVYHYEILKGENDDHILCKQGDLDEGGRTKFLE